MWEKKKPDPIKVEPEPEPQPDWTKDLLNLMIAESAIAQITDIELRDRLATIVEEASLAVARNLGASPTFKRSLAQEWDRAGAHDERGRLSYRLLLDETAGHDVTTCASSSNHRSRRTPRFGRYNPTG